MTNDINLKAASRGQSDGSVSSSRLSCFFSTSYI